MKNKNITKETGTMKTYWTHGKPGVQFIYLKT